MNEPVSIHVAKTHLSRLIARAEAGEEIVIARGRKPVAKLVPIAPKAKRVFGALKESCRWDPSFSSRCRRKSWKPGSEVHRVFKPCGGCSMHRSPCRGERMSDIRFRPEQPPSPFPLPPMVGGEG